VPPPQRRAQEIYDRWMIDVPKLMDLAAIYGPSNSGLVVRLIAQVLELQPKYWGDVAGAAGPLAGNLRELRASCAGLAAKALRGGGGDAALMAELTGAEQGRGSRLTRVARRPPA
jgi:activating signal cointegrator complex subunit 2